MLCLVPLAWLWFRLIKHLSVEWSLNEQYSYGWAVPVLCAYLFYQRVRGFKPTPDSSQEGKANRLAEKAESGKQKAESGKRKAGCETTGQGRVTAGDGDHLTPALSPRRRGSRYLPSSVFYLLAGVLALLYAPTRLIEEANPDWRLVSWALAIEVVGLTLLAVCQKSEGGSQKSESSRPSSVISPLVFPICFFLVAVPWPTVVEGPLIQALTRANAAVTVELINLLGVPALQRGNVIEVATGLVGIDEACSGIRSFQATLMISLFLGELYRLSVVGRFVLCLTGFALSFLFNIGRTSLLVWVASSKGVPAIASWHDPAGIAILVGCFCGLWGVSVVLKRKSESRKQKAKGRELKAESSKQKAESGLRDNRTTGQRTVESGWERTTGLRITDGETENKPTPDPSKEGNTNRLAESRNQKSGNQSNFSFPRPAKSLVCYFTGQPSTFQSFLMPLALCTWIAFVELGVEWWYRSHEVRLSRATEWTVSWPTNSPTFRELPIAEQSRRILRYDEARNATWRESGGTQWQTVFLRWNPGRTALFLARNHTPEVCLAAAGRKVVSVSDIEWLDVNGLRMPFRDYEISDQGRVFHVFYCLWNDRANEQGFETMGLTYGNRLGPVLAGLRNPGQRSIEIAVSGTEDGTSPLAAVREELGILIEARDSRGNK